MKRFIVTLDKDISHDQAAMHDFLVELSEFAGVFPEQLIKVRIRSGCTLIDGYGDEAGLERLYEYFKIARSIECSHPEQQAFRMFLEKWAVRNLVDDPPAIDLPKNTSIHPKKALILVHGWGGSQDETFGSLPDFLQCELRLPVKIYSYPTGWLKKSPSIAFVARNLDNWIRNEFSSHEFALLGHSLGGVVVRYLAVLQECREHPIPIRLISLAASPTDGALLASIASSIPLLRSAQLNELSPNSGFLIDVNERWTWWRKKYTPHQCRVGTMFAMDDAVVNFTSAIGFDPESVPIFGADHTSIVKPMQADHETVKTITRFCREAGICASP